MKYIFIKNTSQERINLKAIIEWKGGHSIKIIKGELIEKRLINTEYYSLENGDEFLIHFTPFNNEEEMNKNIHPVSIAIGRTKNPYYSFLSSVFKLDFNNETILDGIVDYYTVDSLEEVELFYEVE